MYGGVHIGKETSRNSNLPPYHAFDLIVVAGSAGGLRALRLFLSGLPAYLPVPVIVAQHLAGRSRYTSRLDRVLQRWTALPTVWASDGEMPAPGTVYLAPQDKVTVVDIETGVLRLQEPTHHRRPRPAADPLFSSATRRFGNRTVAVVLSGALSDGAAGAAEVVRAGGRVLIQTPAEAQFADMPAAAMRRSGISLAFDAAALAHIVGSLVMVRGVADWFRVGVSTC